MWLNIIRRCEPCFTSVCSRDCNLYPFACAMKAIPVIYPLPFILSPCSSHQRGEQLSFQAGLQRARAVICLALFQLPRWSQFAPGFLCAISLQIPIFFFFFLIVGVDFPASGTTAGIALAGIRAHPPFKSAPLLRCLTQLSAGKPRLPYSWFTFKMLLILLLQGRSTCICLGSTISNSCFRH